MFDATPNGQSTYVDISYVDININKKIYCFLMAISHQSMDPNDFSVNIQSKGIFLLISNIQYWVGTLTDFLLDNIYPI